MPLPDAIDQYIAEEITMEVVIIKNATEDYQPTLGIAGLFEALVSGPQTPFAEVMGPYPLKKGERVLLAQQFKYDPDFKGTYELEFNFRRGDEFVARQKHPLDLQCGDAKCATVKTSTTNSALLAKYLLTCMVILTAVALMVALILTRKRKIVVVAFDKRKWF